jgi:hypothetical protein
MNQNLPQDLNRESLNQLSKEQLVEIIIELIDDWVETNVKKAMNDFVIDEEFEHHIVQALFLSFEFSLCNIFWYSDIYKNPNAFDFNNIMD